MICSWLRRVLDLDFHSVCSLLHSDFKVLKIEEVCLPSIISTLHFTRNSILSDYSNLPSYELFLFLSDLFIVLHYSFQTKSLFHLFLCNTTLLLYVYTGWQRSMVIGLRDGRNWKARLRAF